MNVISRGHHENHMMEIKLGVPPSNDMHTGLSNRFERMLMNVILAVSA